MPLKVLSIGYSLAPVGPDVAGGAEQVLSALDHALVAAGHRSIVVAPQGSRTAGTLVPTMPLPSPITDAVRAAVQQRQREAIAEALARWPVDLIHAHGVDFAEHLPAPGIPSLVTLHLPAEFYPPGAVTPARPQTWFNCVSTAQQRTFPALPNMLPPIRGGVPIERLRARHAKRKFALALGRICPEKGFHLALDAAALAGVPLLIAGQVFPYPYHQRYFDEQIRPRLGPTARFLGPIGFARKRRLLSAARGLLVPSLVAETGSLVAMEALACGTPVVAFPAGALAEIVEPGVTGFLVNDAREMAEAIVAAETIDPEQCRAAARRQFSLDHMVERYFAVYQRLAAPVAATV
ncbi:MAG: glycosyltransferase family 4 protein [Alphaproteobacteria bacterium]|nr:MAG: glycosyltransferase family 4 protein [Alphaproteobacteria bacterium]